MQFSDSTEEGKNTHCIGFERQRVGETECIGINFKEIKDGTYVEGIELPVSREINRQGRKILRSKHERRKTLAEEMFCVLMNRSIQKSANSNSYLPLYPLKNNCPVSTHLKSSNLI